MSFLRFWFQKLDGEVLEMVVGHLLSGHLLPLIFGQLLPPILGHLLPPNLGQLLPLILGHLLSIHKKEKYNHPNVKWRKIGQMHLVWLCILLVLPFVDTFEKHTGKRPNKFSECDLASFQANNLNRHFTIYATTANMPFLRQAIWDDIWKRTVEKSQRNVRRPSEPQQKSANKLFLLLVPYLCHPRSKFSCILFANF